MHNRTGLTTRRALVCGALALGVGISTTALADRDDLITTASTAGTTAYIVGKKVNEDNFAQAQDFADTQAVALRREAATGAGENIDSLAALLGERDSRAFGQWMQSHYAQLYSDDARSQPNLADRIVAMR